MTNVNESLTENREDIDLIRSVARDYLIDFSVATDPRYRDSWFHVMLAEKLQSVFERVQRGEDVRLIIQVPPRHGKSEESTIKFPAWLLGKEPSWPIMVASYSDTLATNFGQSARDLMLSPAYQEIFNTRLRADSKSKGLWKTEKGGGYMAAGAGGAFTGMGFKIGIVDDLFKNREEATSQTIRDSRWDWYRSTFYTRQEGNSAIIVIGTRWHLDDLIGRLIAKQKEDEANREEDYDKWEIVSFPAIATEDERYRKKGEALWPEKYPIEKLRKTETALGPYEFSALYQQNPISSEKQEFKNEWIKTISWSAVEAMNTRKFATIDPGGKEQENDYSGITRNYVNSENMWHIKAIRVHIDSKEMIDVIFKLHDEGFEAIGIEETVYLKAIKPFFDDECRKRGKFPNVIPLRHAGRQKEVRIRGIIPRYSSGSVFHIIGECGDLEGEMATFPLGAYDNTLDSLAYQNDIAEPPASARQIVQEQIAEQERVQEVSSRLGF
jgi:hypothetical protein